MKGKISVSFRVHYRSRLAKPSGVLPAFYILNVLRISTLSERVEYVEGRKNKGPVSQRNRARRVTWFNPPYSKNVITRVGQKFLKLIDKHFPVGSKLRKVFNRNTVKVSYSCMPSMGCIIKQHNARICETEQEDSGQPRHCNCCIPERCPLNGHCLTSKIVYKATVETDGNRAPKTIGYIG